MFDWFKTLLGLKTQQKKLFTNYEGLLKSDMLYERNTLEFLLKQIRSAKSEFDGIDDNIVLQLIYSEEHIKQSIEFLNEGLNECYDDSLEDGEYPVFMSWNEDNEE